MSEAPVIERFLAMYGGAPDPGDLWAPGAQAKLNMRVVAPAAIIEDVHAMAAAVPAGRLERIGRLEKNGETAIVWRFTGTYEQPFMGREATGEEVRVDGATRFALQGDRIHRLVCRWSGL